MNPVDDPRASATHTFLETVNGPSTGPSIILLHPEVLHGGRVRGH